MSRFYQLKPRPPAAAPRPARPAPDWKFSPLDRDQIIRLQALAGEAWKAQLAAGLVTVPTGQTKSAAVKAWRYEQTREAGCPESLSDCNQSHYRPLTGHFAALLRTPGGDAAAYRHYTRTGKANSKAAADDTHEARELWTWKIKEACESGQMAYPGYPAAICQRNYKCPLRAATAEQLRKLFFTVTTRSRGKQAVRSQESAVSPPQPAPENCPF